MVKQSIVSIVLACASIVLPGATNSIPFGQIRNTVPMYTAESIDELLQGIGPITNNISGKLDSSATYPNWSPTVAYTNEMVSYNGRIWYSEGVTSIGVEPGSSGSSWVEKTIGEMLSTNGDMAKITDGTNIIDAAGEVYKITLGYGPWVSSTNVITGMYIDYDPNTVYHVIFSYNGHEAFAWYPNARLPDITEFTITATQWNWYNDSYEMEDGPFPITFTRATYISGTNYVGRLATTNFVNKAIQDEALTKKEASVGLSDWKFKYTEDITIREIRYNDILYTWDLFYEDEMGDQRHSSCAGDEKAETLSFQVELVFDRKVVVAERTIITPVTYPCYDRDGHKYGNWILPETYTNFTINITEYADGTMQAILMEDGEISDSANINVGDTNILFETKDVVAYRNENNVIGYTIGGNTNVVFATTDMIKGADLGDITNYINTVSSNVAVSATNYINTVASNISVSATNYVDTVSSNVAVSATNYTDSVASNVAVSATNYVNEKIGDLKADRITDGTNTIDAARNVYEVSSELGAWESTTNIITSLNDLGSTVTFMYLGFSAEGWPSSRTETNLFLNAESWVYYNDDIPIGGAFDVEFVKNQVEVTNNLGKLVLPRDLSSKLDSETVYSAWKNNVTYYNQYVSYNGRLWYAEYTAGEGVVPGAYEDSPWVEVSLLSIINAKQEALSQPQMDAVNSGVTAGKVEGWDAMETKFLPLTGGTVDGTINLIVTNFLPATGTTNDFWVFNLDGTILRYDYGNMNGFWTGTNNKNMSFVDLSNITNSLIKYSLSYNSADGLYDFYVQNSQNEFMYWPVLLEGSPDGVDASETDLIATNNVLTIEKQLEGDDVVPSHIGPYHLIRYGGLNVVTSEVPSMVDLMKVTNYVNEKIGDIKADRITDGTNVIDAAGNVSTIYRVGPVWEATTNIVTDVSVEYIEESGAYSVYFLCGGTNSWGQTELNLDEVSEFTLYAGYWIYEGIGGGEFDITFIKTVHVATNYVGKLALTNDITAFTNINSNVRIIGTLANGNTNVVASGLFSHAEGANSIAGSGTRPSVATVPSQSIGFAAHAEGNGTLASGVASHAEGYHTIASGSNAFAGGENSEATQGDTIAQGFYSKAKDTRSYVWNGERPLSNPYESNGVGSYNINPVNGIHGIFIGTNSLYELIVSEIQSRMGTNYIYRVSDSNVTYHATNDSYSADLVIDNGTPSTNLSSYVTFRKAIEQVVSDAIVEPLDSLQGWSLPQYMNAIRKYRWSDDDNTCYKVAISTGVFSLTSVTNINLTDFSNIKVLKAIESPQTP